MKNTLSILLFSLILTLPLIPHSYAQTETWEQGLKLQNSKNCKTYPVGPMVAMHYGRFLIDRMEYVFTGEEKKVFSYEVTGWYGGDYQRVWLEAEGEHDSGSSKGGETERLDVMYGRLVSPFWNIRAGAGYKGTYGPDSDERFFGVIGLKGLAPFVFEIDANLRFSNRGEVLMDLEAEYDIWITQKMALQPRLDTSFSFNRIQSMAIGPGFDNLGLSVRLRYEISRKFAPYLGVSWQTLTGGSRDLARKNGEPRDVTKFFTGIRLWL